MVGEGNFSSDQVSQNNHQIRNNRISLRDKEISKDKKEQAYKQNAPWSSAHCGNKTQGQIRIQSEKAEEENTKTKLLGNL